jgi:AsmA family protein
LALLNFALLAIALMLMTFFNWNRAKPFLVDKLEAATRRSFAINGDLTMKWQRPPHDVTGWGSLIPWPHLLAKNVVLGNRDWATTSAPDMARVRQRAQGAFHAPWHGRPLPYLLLTLR